MVPQKLLKSVQIVISSGSEKSLQTRFLVTAVPRNDNSGSLNPKP